MDPSQRFQQTIGYLLQPLQPRLSALHSSRFRPRDPSICDACGSVATIQSRVARSGKARVLQRTCMACHSGKVTPLDRWNPARPSKPSSVPDHRDTAYTTPFINVSQSTADAHTAHSDGSAKIKARLKNRSGLQAMLSRSREQEKERAKNTNNNTGGLSAFLSNL